jgi:phenylacetic acid degradation operon negative regulatory protein
VQSTQSFILFLFAQAKRFPLKETVELGQLLGKSGHSVRACVNRLARSGILIREESPRKAAWYRLSPKGETMADEIAVKFMRIHEIVERKHSWDGTWTLVSFDIPERIRKRRDELRLRLREVGFGLLAGGVWIAPGDVSEFVKSLAESLRVENRIMISLSRDVSLGGVPIASAASRIWPFAELNRKYRAMRSRLSRRIERMHSRLEAGTPPDSREAFLELFIVYSEAAELITQDPCLPEEILPDNWLGLEVQDLIHEHFHMIHGLEQKDPHAFLLRLPPGLHIPLPRRNEGKSQ